MKLNFEFSNLCGSVYKSGNLLFTADGNCVVSAVGNRVSVVDCVANTCRTLALETPHNIAQMAISPHGLLMAVDTKGRASLISILKNTTLATFNFKNAVRALQFSASGRFLAVAVKNNIQVYNTPSSLDFNPFVLLHTFTGFYDDINSIVWAGNEMILASSNDMSARLFYIPARLADRLVFECPAPEWTADRGEQILEASALKVAQNKQSIVLTGHRDAVVGAWFTKDLQSIYTVGKDGSLFQYSIGGLLYFKLR